MSSKKSIYSIILLVIFGLSFPAQAYFSFDRLNNWFSTAKKYVLEKRGWHDVGILACAVVGLAWWVKSYYKPYKPMQKQLPTDYSRLCSECSNYQESYLKELEKAKIKWQPYDPYRLLSSKVNVIGKLFIQDDELEYELAEDRTFVSLKPHLTDEKFVVLTKYQDEYYLSEFSIKKQERNTGNKSYADLIIEMHDLDGFNQVAMSYFSYLDKNYVCMLWRNEHNDIKIIACNITQSNQPIITDITEIPPADPNNLPSSLNENDELSLLKGYITKHVFKIPESNKKKFRWCSLL